MEQEISIEKIRTLLLSNDEGFYTLGKTLDQSLLEGLAEEEIIKDAKICFGYYISSLETLKKYGFSNEVKFSLYFRKMLSKAFDLLKHSEKTKKIRLLSIPAQLPNNIGLLENIEVLNVKNYRKRKRTQTLYSLPDSFGDLCNLKILNLNYNSLSKLPDSFRKLTSLSSLSLNHNSFVEFPSSIKQLNSLKSLDLSYNYIKKLPDFKYLTNLEHLNLKNNDLTLLPLNLGKLTKLKVLDLSYNTLLCSPEEIMKLKNLRRLNIKKNPFSKRWAFKIKKALPNCHIIG